HRTVLRLWPPVRGLRAEAQTPVRLFRAAGAGRRGYRRRDRPQDRSAEQETAAAEMELGRQGREEGGAQGTETPHRGRTGSVRAVSARGVTSVGAGYCAPCIPLYAQECIFPANPLTLSAQCSKPRATSK